MLDFGEWVPTNGVHHDGSDPVSRRNTFPVDWNRSCRQAATAERPDNDFAWIEDEVEGIDDILKEANAAT